MTAQYTVVGAAGVPVTGTLRVTVVDDFNQPPATEDDLN
jgi:hypothetical protein